MAENGYGMPQVAGHVGRIPNYGRPQTDPRGFPEPPACIQNAMMTKDKKPFTYTPGGLDLSQIRTPSMARRLARQRSQEEHEQAFAQSTPNGITYGGARPAGPAPPPPPMPQAPPPPPPLLIEVPNSKSPKPVPLGERPEIVIPENPVAMLRKTNSPYHWEQEQAEREKLGALPKFVEKAPSPNLSTQMPPSHFSQQAPSHYTQPVNRQFGAQPDSPVHKPAPLYPQNTTNNNSPVSPQPTRDLLQRQDSQFNNSPTPFGATNSTISNGSPISPSANWRQPDTRESSSTTYSPQLSRGPLSPINSFKPSPQSDLFSSPPLQNSPPPQSSPPAYHTFPRANSRAQTSPFVNANQTENYQVPNSNHNNNISQFSNNVGQHPSNNANKFSNVTLNPWNEKNQLVNNRINNVKENVRPQSPKIDESNIAPWRTGTLNRNNREPEDRVFSSPSNQQYNNFPSNLAREPTSNSQWKDSNIQNQPHDTQPRYQSHMTIPVTPKAPKQQENKPSPHKEVVFVTQEPVYYYPEDSSKSVPPWVRNQRERTPPPEWIQRPLENRKSIPRESPPKEKSVEPEWVQRSNEMRKSLPRDIVSPPRTQSTQPVWSTVPSENKKSIGQQQQSNSETYYDQTQDDNGSRMIPIRVEQSSREDVTRQRATGNPQPHLRLTIGIQPTSQETQAQPPYSQPTQRIMRVLSPQLVRMDANGGQTQPEPSFPSHQPKERIIPIRMESFDGGANKRVYIHKFACEGPPRQSRAFRVLQQITGTLDTGDKADTSAADTVRRADGVQWTDL